MKSITTIVVVTLACIVCAGCAGQDTFRRFLHGDPVVSGAPEINDNVFLLRNHGVDEESYTETGSVVLSACRPFMEEAAPDATTLKDKDQISLCVYAMHGLIDIRWHRLEHEISATLSTSNFVADVSVLGLTTAATLASVDSAKILAAIAAGITGTRKSWDEDILYSYSLQTILQQMRTDRALVDSQIQARLAPDGRGYDNIYQATNDLYNYAIAGSWEHAMSSLQTSIAATTAACQTRLRNQQMASAIGGNKSDVAVTSTPTQPCGPAPTPGAPLDTDKEKTADTPAK